MPLAEIEMRVIHETLRHTRGDKRLTAKLLGIATRTIYRRLETTDPDAEAADDGPEAPGPSELRDVPRDASDPRGRTSGVSAGVVPAGVVSTGVEED